MPLLSRLAVQAARAYGILSSSDKTKVVADYLVVAGGGGGGSVASSTGAGGGGGAGGYQTSTFTLSTLNTYSIVVGAGGSVVANLNGATGSNSAISGTGLTTVTSIGGGGGGFGGGGSTSTGGSGGSGGGGGFSTTSSVAGTGTSGQGNNGGVGQTGNPYGGGGGGGASATGSNAATNGGAGGTGTASSISGSSVTYSGGGGGGSNNSGGTGGSGGGGNGGSASSNGSAGTANTGGGGGGAGNSGSAQTGGAGGSGIVIISYTSATPKFVGGTLTTSGGNQIHTFTSSGTLSPITPITASYLVVAGGGGGAGHGGAVRGGGGGGAGGYLESTTTLYSGATYIVTVGAGGTGAGDDTSTNGSNSVLSGTGLTTLTSVGGGAGKLTANGATGGSGGGGGYTTNTGGAGTSGQGYAGGNGGTVTGSASDAGGGGGGAGGIGGNGSSSGAGSGGTGGAGVASSITGTSVSRAGGGGGGNGNGNGGTATAGGGTGGGTGGAGTPNSGGGGGGKGLGTGGNGGSGTVIISYAGSQAFNGGLVTTSGGNTIHTFTSTGALTPLTNNLNNSLRFRSSASAYLSRTFTSVGNRKTWTWSGWVKRGLFNTLAQTIFRSPTGNPTTGFRFSGTSAADSINDGIRIFFNDAASGDLQTTQVFRDPSAWYHIVVAVDTTQATAANRVKLYVNGTQVTAFSTATYPSQNFDTQVNNNAIHTIGYWNNAEYFDGYMTDINFIDGQALEPYYFGNNDANGVWKPILYKGTYGTNGFYLTFGNTTSTTTLGYDSSPNGNNWTCNNISLTAGTTYDAMTDSPTLTSATVANYAVINPLQIGAYVTASNGNLTLTGNTSTNSAVATATISFASGKYYYEYTQGTAVSETCGFALVPVTGSLIDGETFATNNAFGARAAGTTYGTAKIASSLTSWASGDVVGIAIDADNGAAYWSKNGVWQTSGVPTSGASKTGAVAGWTPTSSSIVTPFFGAYNGGFINANFGQRPFSYTPPTGFVALNTYNLPTPTILQGNKYMDATLYTGTGTALNVVNAGQFKPDFVWAKNRTSADSSGLYDSVRGVNQRLISNLTNAEDTSSGVSAFNSNGFSLGTAANYNTSGNNFVGWSWQAGQGSTSSNTSGSITSTVSVNTTAGFSIVTYTGTGANATVGHGLGVAPKMIICKNRTDVITWLIYHSSLGATKYLEFNTSAAVTATPAWNNTEPTSSVFTVGTYSNNNGSGKAIVAYCWSEISGYSKFGSYTGNGSADGPMIFTGFTPKFVMFKRTDTTSGWYIHDSSRNTSNVVNLRLLPNTTDAEATVTTLDFLSNGFKLRTSDADRNASGGTYIYAAYAEHPFKNSNAR